jgi:hypothetical protein
MNRVEWVEDRRRYVLRTIEQAGNGTVSLLLAADEIHKWLYALPELTRLVSGEDMEYLKGVGRESKDLPLSTERQYWAAESLREKDLVAQALEAQVREKLLLTFARIADDLKRML